MKFVYAFLLLLILSCNTVKKEYVCGDHLCIDKKEFNEYFSKNFIVEIQKKENKKNKNIDLVKLNTGSPIVEKNDNKNSKKIEKLRIKSEKEKLKAGKIKLLEERKIRESKEKNKLSEAKIAKLKEKNETKNIRKQANKIANKRPEEKKTLAKNNVNNTSVNSDKSKNVKSICDKIQDCDIDKITELLIKKGKGKPFPNIASN
tara:strand:+ start:442 stop:1050 length:609 start_codon:yes stop_codon:yes gene_type:complete